MQRVDEAALDPGLLVLQVVPQRPARRTRRHREHEVLADLLDRLAQLGEVRGEQVGAPLGPATVVDVARGCFAELLAVLGHGRRVVAGLRRQRRQAVVALHAVDVVALGALDQHRGQEGLRRGRERVHPGEAVLHDRFAVGADRRPLGVGHQRLARVGLVARGEAVLEPRDHLNAVPVGLEQHLGERVPAAVARVDAAADDLFGDRAVEQRVALAPDHREDHVDAGLGQRRHLRLDVLARLEERRVAVGDPDAAHLDGVRLLKRDDRGGCDSG